MFRSPAFPARRWPVTSAAVKDEEPGPGALSAEEQALVDGLRRRDEAAFVALVERYHSSLLRLARSFVATSEAAEDVVQETWMGVLAGIDRFEGRSSLKTWIFRILANRAKTKGVRESRSIPFSSLAAEDQPGEPAVDPTRFIEAGRSRGAWSAAPDTWEGIPEDRLLGGETRAVVDEAIAALSPTQQAVITLRDVQGLSSEETRDLLGLTEANQRVLLHRARSKVRARLEEYLGPRNDARAGEDGTEQ